MPSGPRASSTIPPVSCRTNDLPCHDASTSRRSRVSPGMGPTIGPRRPERRPTNVDLPTFGRPMTATTPTGPSTAGAGTETVESPVSTISEPSLAPRHRHDLIHDVVHRPPRRVDDGSPLRHPQPRDLPARIE